jgi:hypothetical protein
MRNLIWLFFFTLPLFAQEEPEVLPTPTPVPEARVQFSVFVWPKEGILMDDSQIEGLPRAFYTSPSGPIPIRLTRNSSTPLLPYTGTLPLILYDIDEVWTDPPADAPPGTRPTVERKPIPITKVEFPPSWPRVMIILFLDKKAADGTMLSLALPYELEALKPGMARIMNASAKPLVLQFDDAQDKPLALKPNQHLDFDPDNLTDHSFARVFVYAQNTQKEMEMVHTSKLFFQDDTTNYFFLYPQGRRRLRIMRIGGHTDGEEGSGPLPVPPSDKP